MTNQNSTDEDDKRNADFRRIGMVPYPGIKGAWIESPRLAKALETPERLAARERMKEELMTVVFGSFRPKI